MYKARAVNCPSPGVNDQVVSHTAAKETCITHHSLSRPYLTSVTANQIPVVEICKVVALFAGHRCESSGARRGPKVRVQANPGVDQLAPLAWQSPPVYPSPLPSVLELFEDPSVENRHPILSPLPSPSAPLCASLRNRLPHLRSLCDTNSPTLHTHTGRIVTPITYSQLFLDSSGSHGCPQVLSMDVRKVSGHFAAHCGEPHS